MKKDIFVKETTTLIEALKKLDKTAEKTLIVIDDNGFLLGTVTDGDIRRYIIKTGRLEGCVKDFYKRNPLFLQKEKYNKEQARKIFLTYKIEVLPIVDSLGKVCDFIKWIDVFGKEKMRVSKLIDVPVIIMAGGKGTRLAPATYVLPKPLIPVGEKTMIEHIIDNFRAFGVKKFYLTLNYKGELIKAYFNGVKKDYEIEFIWEERFLGTAGSLKFLEGKFDGDFIVSNCDVLLRTDFSKILDFHRRRNAIFTSITAIQHYKIPYGVVSIKDGGLIDGIIEKPEYTFQINTGVYILNMKALKYIPWNIYFDMPEFIKKLLKKGENVLAYPINSSGYIDIGQWEDYKKAIKNLSGATGDI